MVWKGASNVGPSGFTIDMNKFQSMSLSSDQKVVTIGTGLSWRQVFSFLLPYNLTTTGGRSSHVGVGGFLMGGMNFPYRFSIVIHPIQVVFRSSRTIKGSEAPMSLPTRSFSPMLRLRGLLSIPIQTYTGPSSMEVPTSALLLALK